jgi:hypothetical protein
MRGMRTRLLRAIAAEDRRGERDEKREERRRQRRLRRSERQGSASTPPVSAEMDEPAPEQP